MTCALELNCCYLTYQTVADLEMKASVQELMAGRTLMHHCMSWRYLVDQAKRKLEETEKLIETVERELKPWEEAYEEGGNCCEDDYEGDLK